MANKLRLDPVTLEILWTRLVSMVDEAAASMVRTSFSTIVRDSNDYAVVLLDTKGRSLAQSSLSIPSFIGTLPLTVRHLLKKFPLETLKPGDVLATNDPWLGTGHLYDINIARPIFRKGKPVAISATVAHAPDIGGRLRSPEIREIYEEGLRIPPVKLLSQGEPDRAVFDILEGNVRIPEQVMGDLWAQITTNRFLEQRLLDLLEETNVDIDALGTEIQSRSEQAMRKAIREMPDGSHSFSMDSDGFEGMPITIACKVTVKGDCIDIDYSGSSQQVPRSVNVVPNYTFSYTAYAVKCVLCPDVPNNEGSFLPITTSAPLGSILNPRYPAAVGARAMTGHILPPVVMGALSKAAPDKVQAASGSPQWCVHLAGEHRQKGFATVFFLNGGQGAARGHQGLPAISYPSNLSNTPIEVMESQVPLLVHRRAVRGNTGGKGKSRGGDGQCFEFEMRTEKDVPITMSFMANRLEQGAPGLHGGGTGAKGRVLLNGRPLDPRAISLIKGGDRVTVETPGGGGFG
ncbi:MAG: hydantoinase B/oxoprolinase family protein [Acetobacterales bacterium]